jgi:hypothetical protein
VLGFHHGVVHTLFEKAQLGALSNGMADGQLHHVIRPRQQRNHVIEDARPVDVGSILEVKLLRLVLILAEWLGK